MGSEAMPRQRASEGRLEELERRLVFVEAQVAITNLKSEYGALADARYTRDGVKPQREVDAIADRLADL